MPKYKILEHRIKEYEIEAESIDAAYELLYDNDNESKYLVDETFYTKFLVDETFHTEEFDITN